MITREAAFLAVQAIMEKEGHDVSGITEETPLKDYVDSIEKLDICWDIERALQIDIPEEEMEVWRTVGDIVNSFEKQR